MDRKPTARAAAAALARTHRSDALERGDAVIVGNRAGIVEWTGDAWSRLTGFPLDETLGKPITHFLEYAGIEVELVDFVAQHFLDGQTCSVELPFETFDGRSIEVLLEVEPLRGDEGAITRFVAVASDVSDRRSERLDPLPEARANLQEGPEPIETPATVRERHVLETILSAAIRRSGARRSNALYLEEVHATDGALVEADGEDLAELLDQLLDAALDGTRDVRGGRAGYITALTGTLEAGRRHISKVHPIPVGGDAVGREPRLFVEVHDTGPHLDASAHERLAGGCPGPDRREIALARAARLAEELGASMHLDSTPGCGTQSLVLFPIARPRGAR